MAREKDGFIIITVRVPQEVKDEVEAMAERRYRTAADQYRALLDLGLRNERVLLAAEDAARAALPLG